MVVSYYCVNYLTSQPKRRGYYNQDINMYSVVREQDVRADTGSTRMLRRTTPPRDVLKSLLVPVRAVERDVNRSANPIR